MMKNIIIGSCVVVCFAVFAQLKTEPAKLVKQEIVEGKKVCHYSDGSKITMRNAMEACPNPWKLLD
jgi:hypothetical protein